MMMKGEEIKTMKVVWEEKRERMRECEKRRAERNFT